MLTPVEYKDFVADITPEIRAKDLLLYGDIASTREALHVQAVAYADRVLQHFDKKRKEKNGN